MFITLLLDPLLLFSSSAHTTLPIYHPTDLSLSIYLQAHFDVFNALTLHDNPLFLENLRFGAGDGHLHYYLYNYRTQPMSGGTTKDDMPDPSEKGRRGIGIVLL